MTAYPKPGCPKCGAVLGMLVHYSKTKVHPLVPSVKSETWSYDSKRTLTTTSLEMSDTADQRLACSECEWTDWGGEHSHDLPRKSKEKPQ